MAKQKEQDYAALLKEHRVLAEDHKALQRIYRALAEKHDALWNKYYELCDNEQSNERHIAALRETIEVQKQMIEQLERKLAGHNGAITGRQDQPGRTRLIADETGVLHVLQ